MRSFLRRLLAGPLAARLRRFVTVGAFTAGVQMGALWLFVDGAGVNYIIAALIAIEFTIILSYVLNNAWTFRAARNSGPVEYLLGLCKTNVVRGTAIPLQLAILYALVEWRSVPYLAANAVAIVLSGIYRYVLDARWTWG